MHFVQAPGVGLVVDLLHVCDGHALVSSRPYGALCVVSVENFVARPSDGVSTAPVVSQWPEDLVVPTGGTKDDCDGRIPLDGEGRLPSVPCFCG